MTDFGAPAYTMATTTSYPTTTPGLPSGGGGGMSGLNGGSDNMGNGGGGGGFGDLPVDLALVVQGSLAALTAGKVVAVLVRRGVKYAWDKALKALRKSRETRDSSSQPTDVESCCPPKLRLGWQLKIRVELLQLVSGENFPSEEEDSRAGFGTVAVCSSCNNSARLEDTVFLRRCNNSTVLGGAGLKSGGGDRVQSTPRNRDSGRFSDVQEEEEMDVDLPDAAGWSNVNLNVANQKRPREV
jgi:hypothetical protein